MIWLLLACAGGPAAEPDAPTTERPASCATAPDVTWAGWTHGFVTTYCVTCHSAAAVDRHGAPEGVDFDSAAATWAARDRAREVVLTHATMPVGGGVLADDLVLFTTWLDCSDGR